jgi:hypothetical protein
LWLFPPSQTHRLYGWRDARRYTNFEARNIVARVVFFGFIFLPASWEIILDKRYPRTDKSQCRNKGRQMGRRIQVRRLYSTIGMKRLLFPLAALLAVVAVVWLFPRAKPSRLGIGFAGFTNGVVGLIVPTFGSLTTNNAAAIRTWLAAGTNGTVFTVTNQNSYAIDILPVARIHTTTNAVSMETPLLNAPTWSGIPLLPGQSTTVQVAALAQSTPWKLAVIYHRRQSSGWASSMADSLSGALREGHSMHSDWVEK